MKKLKLSCTFMLICLSSLFAQVEKPDHVKSTGFFTVNGKIYNPDGTEFIMRGLNQNHFWGQETFNLNSIEGIANTPANCVRVVMSDQDWVSQSNTPAKKRMLVEKYIAKGIVPMVELHDGTCESSPSFIEKMVDSWTLPQNVAWLNEYEKYVILNIANEWGPGDTDADWRVWRDTYKQAITDIRDAGINTMIVIDSPKCGQGPRAMQVYGQEIFDHDPQHNVVFSIHMYGWWRSRSRQSEVSAPNSNNPPWLAEWELQTMLDLGLPVIIGEFSWTEAESVGYDTEEVIAFCQEKGIGWLAWSWNGNGDPVLNMTDGWKYDSDADLKPFGKLIVNHPFYGFRATALQSSVFGAPHLFPNCTLTEPQAGQNLQAGDNVTLTAEAAGNDAAITKVVFYANTQALGEKTGAPYSFVWESVPRGNFSVYAVAWDDMGLIAASEPVDVKVGYRDITKEALFVAGTTDLSAGDVLTTARLGMLGYNVEIIDDQDSAPDKAHAKDLVFISSSVSPTRVKTSFTDVDVPVIVAEYQLFDDMNMATGSTNVDYGRSDIQGIEIVNSAHPIAAGLNGSPTIFSQDAKAAWAKPAAGADKIATLSDDADAAVLFVFEANAEMVQGRAPAPRVGLFVQDISAEFLTINGWTLFDAAIDYAEETTASVSSEFSSSVPHSFLLKQNYPNPFNPSTRIDYVLPFTADVRIAVYNLHGQLVKTLVETEQTAGTHSVMWDGRNLSGDMVANGIYYYSLISTQDQQHVQLTQKMIMLK